MPVTRPFTAEEDITMSISTTIQGLIAKYNGQVDAKAILGSIVANTAIGVNQIIESTSMTFTEKATMRGDLKTLCNRAFRAKLGIVGAEGEVLDADAVDGGKKPN